MFHVPLNCSLSGLPELMSKSANSIFFKRKKGTCFKRKKGNGCLSNFYSDDKKSHSEYKCMGLTWKAYVLVKGKTTFENLLLAGSHCVMDQKTFLNISSLGSAI